MKILLFKKNTSKKVYKINEWTIQPYGDIIHHIHKKENMYEKELQLIGLSPNEAKIYETLLKIGEAGASEIANKSNVHRRSVYDTLLRLTEKGLVFQIFQKNENLYQAVDPRKCLELLKEKEKTFNKILPGLDFFYKGTSAKREKSKN